MTLGDFHNKMKERFAAHQGPEGRGGHGPGGRGGCPRSRSQNRADSPTTNKAVVYKAIREPPVVEERPIPTATGDQVRIKVTSAALNLVDWKIYKYGIIVEQFPCTSGLDVVGVVDQVGPDVKKFKLGDKVMWEGAQFPHTQDINAFQQYACNSEVFVAPIPENFSEDQAAALPSTCFTAFYGLFGTKDGLGIPFNAEKPLASGASVPGGILIQGGGSVSGKFAIQFAKMAGISPIITNSSPKQFETLKALGATHVFDRTLPQDELVKAIRGVTGDDLVYCFDAISEENTQRLARAALSDTKKSIMSGTLPPTEGVEWPKKPEGSEWKMVFGAMLIHPESAAVYNSNIKSWCENGQIKVPGEIKVIPGGLEAVVPALEKLALERPAAKWVVHPQDS